MITIGEYAVFVGEMIKRAEAKQDRGEVVRLCRLLLETLQEKITELQG